MLAWLAFSDDWELNDKVSFDGISKIIYVHPDVTEFDIRSDLYSSWIDWVVLRDHLKYVPALRVTGLDPVGNGIFTGDIYFLINGWKLVCDLTKTKITGVLYSDDYDTAYYDSNLLPVYPASVSAIVNTVSTSGSGATITEIESSTILAKQSTVNVIQSAVNNLPSLIRQELSPELTHITSLQNGLTQNQATMLLELYDIMGLDPTKPLVVTMNSRTAGDIAQSITATPSSTTMVRQ